MICNDKRTKQNKDTLFHYTDNRPVRIGNTERYEIFNVRNLTNSAGALQKGYSRNIDIDSELKRINHYDDKCFQDNYTKHKDKKRKTRYLTRHKKRENWSNYMSAGALSRYILWGEPTLRASIQKYKKRFNLK